MSKGQDVVNREGIEYLEIAQVIQEEARCRRTAEYLTPSRPPSQRSCSRGSLVIPCGAVVAVVDRALDLPEWPSERLLKPSQCGHLAYLLKDARGIYWRKAKTRTTLSAVKQRQQGQILIVSLKYRLSKMTVYLRYRISTSGRDQQGLNDMNSSESILCAEAAGQSSGRQYDSAPGLS